MRLFAALPLPAAAAAAVDAACEPLRARFWPVRWMPRPSLHVTVHFFGDVPAPEVDPLARRVAEAARGEAVVPLAPLAVEAFPFVRRARGIWLALEAPASLELLADRVARAAPSPSDGAGTFRPHVTLARLGAEDRLPADAAEVLAATVLPSAWTAESLVLYESRLGDGIPRYLPLITVPLA